MGVQLQGSPLCRVPARQSRLRWGWAEGEPRSVSSSGHPVSRGGEAVNPRFSWRSQLQQQGFAVRSQRFPRDRAKAAVDVSVSHGWHGVEDAAPSSFQSSASLLVPPASEEPPDAHLAVAFRALQPSELSLRGPFSRGAAPKGPPGPGGAGAHCGSRRAAEARRGGQLGAPSLRGGPARRVKPEVFARGSRSAGAGSVFGIGRG